MQQSAAALMRYLWREKYSMSAFTLFEQFLEAEKIDPYVQLCRLPSAKLQLLMNGSPAEKWYMTKHGFSFRWVGINQVLAKAGKSASSTIKEAVIPLLNELECISCQGSRINPLARHVTINNLSISDLCRLPIAQARDFVDRMPMSPQERKLLDEIQKQLSSRLHFLCEIGLHYLSLQRRAPTLSGGEAQRIRLARQLGSGLTGVMYVLDEPTIGLHPRDNDRLNSALKKLKDLGNTLLLVEHDPLTVATADYILDFGPQAGERGGHITAQGSFAEIKENPHSLTGDYLTDRKTIAVPQKRRQAADKFLSIRKACLHNLKKINVDIPIGLLTCLTGVSGSGKSTLLYDILLPAVTQGLFTGDDIKLDTCQVTGISQFDKVISIDQNPVGHTVRSDVGTYVDVTPKIREFFASLPLARTKGLQGKHFSYNHRRGMCTACWGMGYKKVEMHFLPPVKVVCEDCQGLRLNPISLEVMYAGKNFGQYLDMTINDLRITFQNHPRITRILDTLISVGLGYLKLGQEVVSLSGGEAQRIKLSRELAKRSTGKTLYLLDEPTTGLHSDDINKLLTVLHKLVDKGNTMVIIEHNLDVIKNADYIIELGPEAGEEGGYVTCTGTPEEVVKHSSSWTAHYLKDKLPVPLTEALALNH
jgi:excinuclease ABC subunit A